MNSEIEVTLSAVPGTSPLLWEARVRIYSMQHIFRGSIAAVLAAVRVTIDEIPGTIQ